MDLAIFYRNCALIQQGGADSQFVIQSAILYLIVCTESAHFLWNIVAYKMELMYAVLGAGIGLVILMRVFAACKSHDFTWHSILIEYCTVQYFVEC